MARSGPEEEAIVATRVTVIIKQIGVPTRAITFKDGCKAEFVVAKGCVVVKKGQTVVGEFLAGETLGWYEAEVVEGPAQR